MSRPFDFVNQCRSFWLSRLYPFCQQEVLIKLDHFCSHNISIYFIYCIVELLEFLIRYVRYSNFILSVENAYHGKRLCKGVIFLNSICVFLFFFIFSYYLIFCGSEVGVPVIKNYSYILNYSLHVALT